MFWLTVRQHRMQLIVTAATIAAIGAVLLVHSITTRHAMAGVSGDALDRLLGERVAPMRSLVDWLPAAPVLVGLFWGAPLVGREFENGTHLLAWTQSVPRRRWLVVKLAVLAGAVTLCGLALGAIVSAWLSTFEGSAYADKFGDYGMFAVSGVAAGGWWLFAFMLGTAAGALIRKLLPALAVTLAVFVVVVFGLFHLREDYAAPARVLDSAAGSAAAAYAMPVGSAWLAPDGREVSGAVPGCAETTVTYLKCVADKGYRMVTYAQPADRYWRFQWTEAGILAAGAALLGGVAYQRVARRAL
jgi:ABC-type transport system involved in multi-copper enzyme maturation permease subunit